MTDEDLRFFREKVTGLTQDWGFHVHELLRTMSAIEKRESARPTSEAIVELRQNVSEAVMFRMIACFVTLRAADFVKQGTILDEKDCTAIKLEGFNSLADIESSGEEMDKDHCLEWLPASATLALRLAFRAYVSREFFSNIFKSKKPRNMLGSYPMKPSITTLLMLPTPAGFRSADVGLMTFVDKMVKIDLALKAERFIEAWAALARKTMSGPEA